MLLYKAEWAGRELRDWRERLGQIYWTREDRRGLMVLVMSVCQIEADDRKRKPRRQNFSVQERSIG